MTKGGEETVEQPKASAHQPAGPSPNNESGKVDDPAPANEKTSSPPEASVPSIPSGSHEVLQGDQAAVEGAAGGNETGGAQQEDEDDKSVVDLEETVSTTREEDLFEAFHRPEDAGQVDSPWGPPPTRLQIRDIVSMPDNISPIAWLYNRLSVIAHNARLAMGLEFTCNETTCPFMSGPPKIEYRWRDTASQDKPIRIHAAGYCEKALALVEDNLSHPYFAFDDDMYLDDVEVIVRTSLILLIRVYMHILFAHWQDVVRLGAQDRIVAMFRHLIIFADEFELLVPDDFELMWALAMHK